MLVRATPEQRHPAAWLLFTLVLLGQQESWGDGELWWPNCGGLISTQLMVELEQVQERVSCGDNELW